MSNAKNEKNQEESSVHAGTERYLCFALGPEDYAIPLLSVREVIALPEITPVPQTPAYYMGIINLRGQIISVFDIRSKLGIKPVRSVETAVIICDVEPNSIGIVVDSINYVANPSPEEIKAKPDIQSHQSAEHISNIFRSNGKLILVLDIKKVLTVHDHQSTQMAQQKVGT